MASYRDAAAGWRIFQAYHGQVEQEELNQLLEAQGFSPIADRTMDHYRKLSRLGYDEYMSINRLDIRHASDSVFDVTDRSRYEDLPSFIRATLFIPTATPLEVLEVPGIVSRFSEGFTSFRLTAPNDEVIQATRSTKYNRGVLRFDVSGFERAVRISEAVEIDDTVEVLLTFRSLLSADLLFPERVGPISRAVLTLALPDDPTLHTVVTSVHRSFDLFESLRGLVDTLTSGLPDQDRTVSVAPRVQRIQSGSPLIQELVGTYVVWILVGYLIKWLLNRIKTGTEIDLNLQRLEHNDAAERRAEERHQIEMKALQLSALKEELTIGGLLQSMEPELRTQFEQLLADSPDSTLLRLNALKDQALEAGAELIDLSEDIAFSHDKGQTE